MKNLVFYFLFFGFYFLYSTEWNISAEPQEPSSRQNIQAWLHESMRGTYSMGANYACSMSSDSSVLTIGNNIDCIWCFDVSDKRLVSVIHHDFGGFVNAGFVVSDDGRKLAVRNNLGFIFSEIKDKLPKKFLENDWSKKRTSFWIYDIQKGEIIKILDTVALPYSNTTDRIILDSKFIKDANLFKESGVIIEKLDTKRDDLFYIDLMVDSGHFEQPNAHFCFSKNSNELITWLLGNSIVGNRYATGVLAEKIDIQSNDLKQVYVYSDYNEVREWVARGVGYFGPITNLSRSGNGKYLALMGLHRHFALFDQNTGKVIFAQRTNYHWGVQDGCFKLNYDGSLVACQTSLPITHKQCRVVIFETKTAKPQFEIITPDPLFIKDIAFSQNNQYIVLGTIWGHVFVWDIKSRKLIKQFSLSENNNNTENISTTIVNFYKGTDEIIAVFLEQYNKSGQVYKYKISDGKAEKLFDFPP
jgi:WD40 repeat protein